MRREGWWGTMKLMFKRFAAMAGSAILGLALLCGPGPAGAADTSPADPVVEAGRFRLGIEPWLGYGQWYVAAEKGTFARNGLSGVDIIDFEQDHQINAALIAGKLDGANVSTHTALAMVAAGLPVKIVMLLDFSLTADAVLGGETVSSIADLKGKRVAYEQGTTSDILLNVALRANGMTLADVEAIHMPAADAGTAMIAGRVAAAVTYEPYISALRAAGGKFKPLFTAAVDPGIISDVLVVRDDVIANRPKQITALIRSWDDALADYKLHTVDDRGIIAKALRSTPAELDSAFEGVRYYSLAENKDQLMGVFASKVLGLVEGAARQAGILTVEVPGSSAIDPRFVQGAR